MGARPAPRDETEAIRRAAGGDPDALQFLYDRYEIDLYRLIYHLSRNSADARDIVQDVFVGLPEALSGYEGRGSFEGWLRKLALRTWLMKRRGGRRRRRRERMLSFLRGRTPNRDEAADVVDRVEVERAMASLSEALRTVLVLKHVEGYSHSEIARLLGITPQASATRLCRARTELRRMLGDGA